MYGIQTTQNTWIASNATFIQSAYTQANTANVVAQSSYNFANTVNIFTQSAYTQANASNVLAQTAYNQGNTANLIANTAAANIAVLFGIQTTQNTWIASNAVFTQSVYTYANTLASASGYTNNSIIFANSTGYISNTINLSYYASNNNLVLTGNIIAGGVRTTTSNTAPTNPTVGDLWYIPKSDISARYTYDGNSYFWLDITGPTMSANQSNVIVGNTSITGSLTLYGSASGTLSLQPPSVAGISSIVLPTTVSSSTTNTVTNKIPIVINGTTYYLLASTSGT